MGDKVATAKNRAKSKWGKVFSADKSGGPNFKLNEDVTDFLKPSTEKYSSDGGTRQWSSAPRIDVAIAQRWPDPGQVKRTVGSGNVPDSTLEQLANRSNGWSKRRKNLTVGFVKTPPEVIGEGGDEAEMPAIEVSRTKARTMRSVSDSRAPPPNTAAVDTQRHVAHQPMSGPPKDPYGRPDMHRAKTSAGEVSYQMQHKPYQPPLRPLREPERQQSDPRPGMLKRAPTGFTPEQAEFSQNSVQPQPTLTNMTDAPAMPPIGLPSWYTPTAQMQREPVQSHFHHREPSSPPFVQQYDHQRQPSSPPLIYQSQCQREPSSSSLSHHSRELSSPASSQYQREPSSPPDSVAPLPKFSTNKAQNRTNAEARTFRRVSRQVFNPDDLAELRSLSSAGGDSSPRLSLGPELTATSSDSDYGSIQHGRRASEVGDAQHGPLGLDFHYSQNAGPSFGSRYEPVPQSLAERQRVPPRRPVSGELSEEQHPPRAYESAPQSLAERQRVPPRRPVSGEHFLSEAQSVLSRKTLPENVLASNGQLMPEQQTGSARSVFPDTERTDSMRPKPLPSLDPIVQFPQRSDDHSVSPGGMRRVDIPRIDTSCSTPTVDTNQNSPVHDTDSASHSQGPEFMLSPQDHRSMSDILSPISSSTTTPDALKLPSPNYLRPAGTLQGITPSPNREPASSYFASHPSQTLSPQAASPSMSYDPYQSHSRSNSQNSHYRDLTPPSAHTDTPESAAYADFASRVAHMKGVFRLTAEREQPISNISPQQWLRCAMWWLHRGRAGLGQVVRNVQRGPDGLKRELLTQPHVDVAKTWWIVTDMLEDLGNHADREHLRNQVETARSNLYSLTLSMQRNDVMPPHQSLIQGQDTTIWIRYPRFAPDAASLLRGSKALVMEDVRRETDPLEALPAGDTRATFFYNRMMVDVSVNTDEAETDRVVMPCILTMLRSKSQYQPTIIISSQIDLVNVCVSPGCGNQARGPGWQDVSFKARSHGLYIRLPRGFSLNVEMQESDFRALLTMLEYTKRIEASLSPVADEKLVHEARLVELQYSDSSNPHAFPKERMRSCTARVFERFVLKTEGTGTRKLHRGFRFLLVTNPVNKTLSGVTHELCRGSPFLFENIGNPAAGEVPAMVIRVREPKRACKALLIFSRADERVYLYDVLNNIILTAHETFTAQSQLKTLSIEPAAAATPGSILPGSGALESLRWDSIRIVNVPTDSGKDPGYTVLSENLRIIATNESGSLTDRMNLSPGELLLRLPVTQPTTLQILRSPQDDLTISLDTRHSPPHLPQHLSELLQTTTSKPTIRTLIFPSLPSLHAFQTALTRNTIRFDGSASLFSIARRRMVVPVYKKLEATHVRIQIVSQGPLTQIAAFFDNFAPADAMVFQIRASDVFEKMKGDKSGKFAIKLVDAKFSLPKKEKERDFSAEGGSGGAEEGGGVAAAIRAGAGVGAGVGAAGAGAEAAAGMQWPRGVRRRFVNFENLEYAEEHDDVVIGFDAEAGMFSVFLSSLAALLPFSCSLLVLMGWGDDDDEEEVADGCHDRSRCFL